MKIGNVEVTRNEEVLVLPRPTGDLVIKALAVSSMDEFETLCPPPKAPGIRTKEGFKPDTDDETYRSLVSTRDEQRMHYLVIRSLEVSEIEWETVKADNPSTWKEWTNELKAAGVSDIECGRIVTCVLSANSLNEEKLQAAREVFLHGQAQ